MKINSDQKIDQKSEIEKKMGPNLSEGKKVSFKTSVIIAALLMAALILMAMILNKTG